MTTINRQSDADLQAVRAWTAAERAAERAALARTVAHLAVTGLAAAASIWLLRH